MLAAELLILLTQHAGREYQAALLAGRCATSAEKSKPKRQKVLPAPEPQLERYYLFTARGEQIEATGPSRQTRVLSAERFVALFAGATFGAIKPTGRLSDLGPLFAALTLTPSPTHADMRSHLQEID